MRTGNIMIGAVSNSAIVEYTEKGETTRLYFDDKIKALQQTMALLKTFKKAGRSEATSSITIKTINS